MAAPSLRETQQLFVASLTNATNTQPLSTMIDNSYGASPHDRIAVYTDAYYLRLQEVLSEEYSHTLHLLGDDAFTSLARAYVMAHRSKNPSVIWFGRDFPDFLVRACADMAWLAEVARLEWLHIEVFCAPASHFLALTELAAIPPDQWAEISFTPVPSLRCLECRWPVDRLWAQESTAGIEAKATSLRVWRNADYQVRHARMDHREAVALELMRHGAAFGAIVEVFGDTPEAPADAASLLGRWLADGLISEVAPPRLRA
jgi:hypothetical protein